MQNQLTVFFVFRQYTYCNCHLWNELLSHKTSSEIQCSFTSVWKMWKDIHIIEIRFWEVILNNVMLPLLEVTLDMTPHQGEWGPRKYRVIEHVDDVQSLSRGIYSSKLTTPRSQQKGVSLICPADCVTGCFFSINPYYGKATPDTCHSPYYYESFMPRVVRRNSWHLMVLTYKDHLYTNWYYSGIVSQRGYAKKKYPLQDCKSWQSRKSQKSDKKNWSK
jgi:hypothetical protein